MTNPADDAFASATLPPDKPVDVTLTDDKVTSDEDGEYRVVTKHNNVAVFSGTQTDARTYLERNFPRPHIELGTVKYGAVLMSPSGTESTYDTDQGWS